MRFFLLALLPLTLLAACATDTKPALHEVNLVGSEYVRLTWFYGEPRELDLGGQTVTLSRLGAQEGQMVVTSALAVDGEPFLREGLTRLRRAPTEASYIEGSSDMRVVVGQDAAQVLYWDGDIWFTLLEDASAGVNTRVVPVPRLSGLQGLAQLNRAESAALGKYLEGKGPTVLTVLDTMPSAARTVSGAEEYLRSGFYLQRQISTLAGEAEVAESEMFFDVIAAGSNALASEAGHRLIGSNDELREAWNAAYGTVLMQPELPVIDWERETVLALFMGSRNSGGYSISLERLSSVGNEIYADVRFGRPEAGAITTQALTSPWQLVKILRGGVNAVWLRDADTGRLLGAISR